MMLESNKRECLFALTILRLGRSSGLDGNIAVRRSIVLDVLVVWQMTKDKPAVCDSLLPEGGGGMQGRLLALHHRRTPKHLISAGM